MPRWRLAELDDAPRVGWKGWAAMIGPGLVLAGAAIGSGEWLLGPAVSARYGGALLWVATLSLLAQLVYNLEASRYTLYCGEPIFTGKFRTLPGPAFWLGVYLILDFGALLPYQITHAATAVSAMWLGQIPNPDQVPAHATLVNTLTYVLLAVALSPLLFGGKVYNSVKTITTLKIVLVLGFLLIIAVLYSSARTWIDIATGFVRFGTVPVEGPPGSVANVFMALWRGEGIPRLDANAIPLITAFGAIAGIGGLAQSSISNYTREQGWGMGKHVGAIPSVIRGQKIALSHSGAVFQPRPDALVRWRRWQRHVIRDQVFVWFPAAAIGMALPSMLSIEFLPRGTVASQWMLSGMTAGGVADRVGGALGGLFWYGVLLCGFLVLQGSSITNADSFIRRWLDAAWTAVGWLRRVDTRKISMLYFAMLVFYFVIAVIFLSMRRPMGLIVAYGNLGNLALGVSCFHTLAVNRLLMPREVRPGLWRSFALMLAGVWFLGLAAATAYVTFR